MDVERIAADSQQEDDSNLQKKTLRTVTSAAVRQSLAQRSSFGSLRKWIPRFVRAVYHKNQDRKVRSLKKLLKIYYNSVGANATLLLNIPPINAAALQTRM